MLFVIMFISMIVISSMLMLRKHDSFKKSDMNLVEKDYEMSISDAILKLNFYYSIKHVYEKSVDKDSFNKEFLRYSCKGISDALTQKYYKDSRLTLKKPEDKSVYNKIEIEREYIEFYVIVEYVNGDSFREDVHKCRVYNPYTKYSNLFIKKDNVENDKEIDNKEIQRELESDDKEIDKINKKNTTKDNKDIKNSEENINQEEKLVLNENQIKKLFKIIN